MFTCEVCHNPFKSIYALRGHSRMHGPSNGINEQTEKTIAKRAADKEQRRLAKLHPCPHCSKETRLKFCSRSCSTTYTNLRRAPRSEESKKRTSKALTKTKHKAAESRPKKEVIQWSSDVSQVFLCKCRHCGVEFVARCKSRYCMDHKSLYRSAGRNQFAFTFNVFHYPDLFNLEIIKQHGWHSYGGRQQKNLNGLTRDHKVSVNEAIKNQHDPYYIKHPLNCEIMTFLDNNKKKTRSSITYRELVESVNIYDSLTT